jgi:tRNA pseudouridine13 synthase
VGGRVQRLAREELRGQSVTERYLTAGLPGIGGTIRQRPEDFVVEELPLYPASGEGDHTFLEIRKEGLSTFQAVRLIARDLRVSPHRVGYAGLKDARAVTCQVLSVEGVAPEVVSTLQLPGISVLWAERHRNKLKIGHLRGNRFRIRIRDVAPSALPASEAILGILSRRGAPNYYGPQRFGLRGNSADLGRAIVRRDAEAFVRAFVGEPGPSESAMVSAARSRFEAGDWLGALDLLPVAMVDERSVLQRLIHTGGNYQQAYLAVPKRLRVFLLSAYQSLLFNCVLDARLQTLDHVYVGDLAMKHPGHSLFRVEDEALEQPRATRFEISPTGPIFGYRMMEPLGRQGDLEAHVLAAESLTPDDFRVGSGIKARGERRSLRFQIKEPELCYDEGVVLRFWLDPGCYATAVLAEVMKAPLVVREEAASEVAEL